MHHLTYARTSLISIPPPPLSSQVQDVKAARLLASEITQTGAKVHDLLANEATERYVYPLLSSDLHLK